MADSSSSSTSAKGTHRHIGMTGATLIGVGAIVGGGVLALAGAAFSHTGPSTMLAFALNGVIAFITAMSFAEMTTAFPENGGAYAFTKKVLSVQTAFAVGWILWFAMIAASVLYGLGFSIFTLGAIQAIWAHFGTPPTWLTSHWSRVALASIAVVLYSLMLTRAKGGHGALETIGKMIVFTVMIIAGAWALTRGGWHSIPTRLSPFMTGGFAGLATAMGYTFISLQGFDIIATVAGEVKDPGRVMPRSMFLSLGIALLVYIPFLFVVSTVGVNEGDSIVTMSLPPHESETMIAAAVGNFMGPAGFWVVMGAGILSMMSALVAHLLAASRIAYAMASDRTLPRYLAKVSPGSGSPTRAIAISSLITILILCAVPNVAAAGAAASLIFLLGFTLTHITSILARRRGGIPATAWRTPWFPAVPVVGGVLCASLAIFQGFADHAAGIITAVWLAAGFILYFTTLADRAEVMDARTMAHDPSLARLRGHSPLVLVPIANPRHVRAMVETAHALTPPESGRVLLLSVVRSPNPDDTTPAPVELIHTQDVLREALSYATTRGINPEALVTIAYDPFAEIRRVAEIHRCESLLIGLSALDQITADSPMENLLRKVGSNVVILSAPPDWELSRVRRVLVPVAGGGTHDRLRARLLASVCRNRNLDITYLRVVTDAIQERDLRRLTDTLRQEAEDEVAVRPIICIERVVAASDAAAVVARHAVNSDLVILGLAKPAPGRPAIGTFSLAVAAAAGGATILISHHD